jgi:glycosyltransferase involved in cell wall biosynthesis
MVEPLISIVIPTFDRSELAQGAIKNVLDQSYNNFEVIVVEDGSSTGLDEFIKGLGNEKVIYASHETNRGLGSSRNTGMNLSKGDYIAFLDDDDRWLKDKLMMQVDIMQRSNNPKIMVYCRNVPEKSKRYSSGQIRNIKGPMSDYIFQGFLLPSSSILMHTSALKSIGGHSMDIISCIDHDIWMKLAKNGFYMDLVEEGLIYSVDVERKRMVNQFDERLKGIEQFFKKWKPEVIKEYGIESWMKIERIYHCQTSYGIVDRYRKGIISNEEGINYLKELFLLQSKNFSWFDILIARFGLKFSTRVLDFIPL